MAGSHNATVRHVSCAVPDSDTSEVQLQRFAEELRAGHDIIVLRRPDSIPEEAMPSVVAKLVALLQMMPGAIRMREEADAIAPTPS